jgi:RND family efflux transporter MFP subunit
MSREQGNSPIPRSHAPAAAVVAAVLGALALAVGIGYQLGTHGVLQKNTSPAAGADVAPSGAAGNRKIRYYRNPMGLPDTSPTPKKDSMGMDYIPVYEGEDEAGDSRTIKVSTEKIQKLGVRIEPVERRRIERSVRATGRVEIDERRVFTVAPRFEGWVDRLLVNATGQPVAKGAPLFEAYSPELVSAQREYAIAAQGRAALHDARPEARAGMQQLADAALLRLRNWEIGDADLKGLAAGGESKRTLTFRAPVSGIVLEKKAVQGMRFMPGEALYQIADLSSVWIVADVNEQDIAEVRTGAKAKVSLPAYPGKVFTGTIAYVYPTLKSETRSVQVRVELANPGSSLKPGMFAQVEMASGKGESVIAVPTSAVIDSGARQVVLISLGEGRFEPRDVKPGARGERFVEVREGLREGEQVVVAANFLLDAESNLKAALTGLSAAPDLAKSGSVQAKAAVGHHGEGTLDAVDAAAGSVTITHTPIASLGWPGMTMDFTLANASLGGKLKAGSPVRFEFVERKPGEWLITKLEARGDAVGPVTGKASPAASPTVNAAPDAYRR